jgi:hypothetical protein
LFELFVVWAFIVNIKNRGIKIAVNLFGILFFYCKLHLLISFSTFYFFQEFFFSRIYFGYHY